MDEQTLTLDAPDGHPIHVVRFFPASEPRAIVQVAHGMSEHAGRYRVLGEQLTERGFALYVSDHRGHGGSVPPGEAPGHLGDDGFDMAAEVVRRLGQHIAREHPEVRRVLMGHSFGSFVVQRLLSTDPELAHAFVLSGSDGKPKPIAAAGRYVARLERLRLGPRGKSQLIDALTFQDFNRHFKPNRTDFDWLSRDAAEVDAYAADPMCGFVLSVQSWVDLLDALGGLTASRNLARIPKDTPIYIFAGTRDPVGDFGRGVTRLTEAYRAAGLRRVEMRLYPGARHETLHETNRAEVMADLVSWIERTLGL